MLPEEFFVASNAENISAYTANHIGDACQTDRHCSELSNTRCQGGKCTCKDGTYQKVERCFYPRMFMIERDYEATVLAFESSLKNCTSDSDCGNMPNLHCFQGKCVCSKGFQLQNNECQEMTKSTCSKHYQCSHGTIRYYLNTCRYFNEFFSSDDADKYTTEGWESDCWTDRDCRDMNNTVCFENRYVCKSGYRRNFLTDKCQELPDRTCDNDDKCLYDTEE
ncbi:Protein of unknown function, partial [Cotesia congregata]